METTKVHTPAGRTVHVLREVTAEYGPVTMCNRTICRDYTEADPRVPVTCTRCKTALIRQRPAVA